jgi:hypothetical protein
MATTAISAAAIRTAFMASFLWLYSHHCAAEKIDKSSLWVALPPRCFIAGLSKACGA